MKKTMETTESRTTEDQHSAIEEFGVEYIIEL